MLGRIHFFTRLGQLCPFLMGLTLLVVLQLAGINSVSAQVDVVVDPIYVSPIPTPDGGDTHQISTQLKITVSSGLELTPSAFSSSLTVGVPEGLSVSKLDFYDDHDILVYSESVGSLPYSFTISELGAGVYEVVATTSTGTLTGEARKL